jgi:hypothetical protein
MDLVNFRLLDMITIEAKAKEWDLHNAFSLDAIIQRIPERTVTLAWKLSGYGTPPSGVERIEIVFRDVDYFEVTPRDAEIPDFGEDLCLSMMQHEPLLGGGFHLQFEFRGGQNVRVGAREAKFYSLPMTDKDSG